MQVTVTTKKAETPAIPTSGGLVFVTGLDGVEQAGIYAPGMDIVAYPRSNISGSNVGFDFFSTVRSRTRGARQGESLLIAA